jgi:hypothetical protein
LDAPVTNWHFSRSALRLSSSEKSRKHAVEAPRGAVAAEGATPTRNLQEAPVRVVTLPERDAVVVAMLRPFLQATNHEDLAGVATDPLILNK